MKSEELIDHLFKGLEDSKKSNMLYAKYIDPSLALVNKYLPRKFVDFLATRVRSTRDLAHFHHNISPELLEKYSLAKVGGYWGDDRFSLPIAHNTALREKEFKRFLRKISKKEKGSYIDLLNLVANPSFPESLVKNFVKAGPGFFIKTKSQNDFCYLSSKAFSGDFLMEIISADLSKGSLIPFIDSAALNSNVNEEILMKYYSKFPQKLGYFILNPNISSEFLLEVYNNPKSAPLDKIGAAMNINFPSDVVKSEINRLYKKMKKDGDNYLFLDYVLLNSFVVSGKKLNFSTLDKVFQQTSNGNMASNTWILLTGNVYLSPKVIDEILEKYEDSVVICSGLLRNPNTTLEQTLRIWDIHKNRIIDSMYLSEALFREGTSGNVPNFEINERAFQMVRAGFENQGRYTTSVK